MYFLLFLKGQNLMYVILLNLRWNIWL